MTWNIFKNLSSEKSPCLPTQGEERCQTFCTTERILVAIHWPSFVEIRETMWPKLVEAPMECLLKEDEFELQFSSAILYQVPAFNEAVAYASTGATVYLYSFDYVSPSAMQKFPWKGERVF